MKTARVFARPIWAAVAALAVTSCSANGEHRLGAIVAASDAAVAFQDGASDAGACQTAPRPAESAPLDMYLMVEKSLSNQSPGRSEWDAVARGISGFVTTSDIGTVGVGIQRFPLPGGSASAQCVARCGATCDCLLRCGCGVCDCADNGCRCASRWFASCELADYATPAVEIASLPAASNELVAWLFSQNAEEGPATARPALQGAVRHAHDWAAAHSGRNVIVVLLMNGVPSQEVCQQNRIDDMTQVAAAAADGTPSVSTFVVASGSDLAAVVDPIASAGGSGHAWNVGTDAQRGMRLSSVLAQIRDSAVACQYAVPKGDGAPFDYAAVGVELRLGSTSSPTRLTRVQDRGDCRRDSGGWYFDDPQKPTRIVLCDSTCSAVQESTHAAVTTMLGCPLPPDPQR
jgi:hypothetical protein